MEGVPFDWNDYLSAEGLSDVALAGPSFPGGQQASQDGTTSNELLYATNGYSPSEKLASPMIHTSNAADWPWIPMRDWHDQQLASQHSFYIADESQEYNIAGHLDREEDLSLVAIQDDTIASQDQYQHHGSTSNLEMLEAGIDPVPPQQAPGSTVSLTETGQEVPTQDFNELETLVPDQVCTCAACLDGYRCPGHLQGLDGHPERISWTFACRVTGCQWTTKDSNVYGWWSNLQRLHDHEHNCPHYGKSGNWRCPETGCKFVTKRWNDLKRHSSSKHCIKPKTFECPILSCKYHQIGFTRKDKLKSHCQNVHAGMLQPGKPNQAIQPKANGSA